jgi:hypothetical protein
MVAPDQLLIERGQALDAVQAPEEERTEARTTFPAAGQSDQKPAHRGSRVPRIHGSIDHPIMPMIPVILLLWSWTDV